MPLPLAQQSQLCAFVSRLILNDTDLAACPQHGLQRKATRFPGVCITICPIGATLASELQLL